MLAYLEYWAVAFIALGLAVVITGFIYQSMGDGLDLNGWVVETLAALFVSAAQAGGYLLEQRFPMPHHYSFGSHNYGSVGATVFFLSIWLGYKVTHWTTWDNEYIVVAVVQAVLLLAVMLIAG